MYFHEHVGYSVVGMWVVEHFRPHDSNSKLFMQSFLTAIFTYLVMVVRASRLSLVSRGFHAIFYYDTLT